MLYVHIGIASPVFVIILADGKMAKPPPNLFALQVILDAFCRLQFVQFTISNIPWEYQTVLILCNDKRFI